jgi:SAM-dependent methyltransferase
LWGTGLLSKQVILTLSRLNIYEYSFIDKDKNKQSDILGGKKIYSPQHLLEIDKSKLFVIIACGAEKEIKTQLREYGFEDYVHFIDGVNLENEFCTIKYCNIPSAKPVTNDDLNLIISEMKTAKLNMLPIKYTQDELNNFEANFCFPDFYKKTTNPFYFRKLCEYWFASQILKLPDYKKEDIYIDVGSSSTPWVMELREKFNINAFGVDLEKNPLNKEYYLVEDATSTSFENNSVSGISLQSTFCLFAGHADIRFIHECARILKPGGKVVILPLYMYPEYISLVSPQFYNKGYNDNEQKEYLRRDWPNIRMSRYYDVKHLKSRIINEAEALGLKHSIFILPDEQIPPYEFAYLKFILMLEK